MLPSSRVNKDRTEYNSLVLLLEALLLLDSFFKIFCHYIEKCRSQYIVILSESCSFGMHVNMDSIIAKLTAASFFIVHTERIYPSTVKINYFIDTQ